MNPNETEIEEVLVFPELDNVPSIGEVLLTDLKTKI